MTTKPGGVDIVSQQVSQTSECLVRRAAYNEGLRRRGDLTIWFSEDAIGLWLAARRTTRSGQRRYSNLAIELCLTLGMVFKQSLRQT
jgi:hypothetical protein